MPQALRPVHLRHGEYPAANAVVHHGRLVSDPARRPLLATSLMLCATVSFVFMQAVVKDARESGVDPNAVMFFRTAPGLPFLWWVLHKRGERLAPDRPGNLFVRSLFGSVAMATNFTAMRYMSLGQFSTLQLSQPVFVALIAPLLLKERVRPATWLAMALAGSGALVMLLPESRQGSNMTAWAASLGVTSALASAFAMIWVRKATETDPAERVVFYFAAWVSLVSLLIGLSRGSFTHFLAAASPPHLLLWTVGMAGFGTLGQVLMTRAYIHGEATLVALVGYSGVLFSMLLDFALFSVSPADTALLGAGLMIAAAIMIVRK
jgi:drug/metabolite transporter (DMT)-like permease